MPVDTLQGKWTELRGKVKQRWGQITDNDLDRISGKRDELAGLLQQKYGYAKEKAEQEIDQFFKSVNRLTNAQK
ncbi:MAG: CsbD family protein [Chloroflexi bacterium]|nr:CsbD family protein [Chloroflexota bacterium]